MPQQFADEIDDQLVYERCETFGGGMDNYNHPTLLQPDQYQYGLNIFLPDSLDARTRPGADRIGTVREAKIQGLFYFDTPAYEQLITASNGKLYQVGSGLALWTEMVGWTLHDGDARFSAAQGIDKVLFCDGTALASWDGAAFTTYNNGPLDPPTGASILLWHAGRMWAAGFPGDGTAGKEDDAICVSSLLTFGNGDWDRTDRSFRVGSGTGDPIMGLCSLPASVPEQSVLGVLKQNSIYLIRTDPTQPLTQMTAQIAAETASSGLGVVGKRAFAVVGGDLLFIATDKTFRSLARMQAAAGQYQVDPQPISTPLGPYMDRINWSVQSLFTVWRYKHLAFFSVALDNAQTPDTVFAYNGRLGRWMGVWTGWTPNCWETTRFNGVTRLMHGDNAGNVRQWKDYADATDDATYLDDGAAIATEHWQRAFLFGEPLNNKDAFHYEARFSSANAVVTFKFMGDNVQLKQWTADLRPTGPNLEIDLEFDLENPSNVPTRKGLRDLPDWNECFVKISAASGWFSLRNSSMSAYLNTLKNQ